MPLQIRRGTDAERLAMTQPLAQGELLFVSTPGAERLFIGNGVTLGGVQITGYTNEDAQDAAALLFSNGVHNGITFTYNDAAASLNAAVNLTNYQGIIQANAFKGSVFADDSSLLVDAVSGRLLGPLTGNVTGNVTGNLTGYHTGDVKGSVFGDDSSLLIDAVAGRIVGPVFSNVTGNLTGNVTGNLTGNTNGYHSGDVKGSIFGDDSSVLVDAVAGKLVGTLIGNVTTPAGASIINTTTKAATFNSIVLDSIGLITGTAMTVTIPTVTYATDVVSGTTPFFNFFVATASGTDSSPIALTRSRGTLLSPAAITSGDELGSIISTGYSGSTFTKATEINAVADGAVSAGVVPSRIDVAVCDSAGTLATRMAVKAAYVDFVTPPKLPVVANDTARTTLVPTPATGMMIFMSSGTTPAATNKVQVYDGSAWVNLH